MNSVVDAYIENYQSISVWEEQDVYLEIFVEKKDLVGIFKPVCKQYNIPITVLVKSYRTLFSENFHS